MDFFQHQGLGFFIFKWIHFLAGITWIGVLYYFNFIQGEWFKEIEDQTKGEAVRTLVPRALWWFRWGAMFTFLSGAAMLGMEGHPKFTDSYVVYIYIGALMGTLMFLNVWLIIWPAQQVVIASSESVASGGEANPNVAGSLAKAGLASRTNTLFSIPMLFFMGAARNYPSSWGPADDLAIPLYGLIFAILVILLIEVNAIKGKMGPMASVKGVIHCGLLLTVVLYCSHCFL